jgi:hypothetical protein
LSRITNTVIGNRGANIFTRRDRGRRIDERAHTLSVGEAVTAAVRKCHGSTLVNILTADAVTTESNVARARKAAGGIQAGGITAAIIGAAVGAFVNVGASLAGPRVSGVARACEQAVCVRARRLCIAVVGAGSALVDVRTCGFTIAGIPRVADAIGRVWRALCARGAVACKAGVARASERARRVCTRGTGRTRRREDVRKR